MNRVINWLSSIRLGKVITLFLSAVLLFVSTACGTTGVLAKTSDQVRQEVPKGAVTSPYEGGMNQYSDTDPRRDTSKAEAKAKALVDRSEANIKQKSVDSTEQYVQNYKEGTPLGKRIQNIGEDVGGSTKELTKGLNKGTQKGVDNLKDNTQNAVEGTKQAADKAPDAVKSKVHSDVKNTKESLDKAGDIGKQATDKAQGGIKGAIKEALDAID